MIKESAIAGLTTYVKPGLTWVDITQPSAKTLDEIKRHYPFFLDIDLRDCLPPFQRPKLLERPKYIFIVLLFPIFDRDTKTIRSSELDLFIGRDFIVTNHFGELQPLLDLATGFADLRRICPIEAPNCPASWLHAALSSLLISCFPMLTHISNDINDLELALFRDTDGRTVKEILRVKSNIVDFRKIMQGHKHIIEKFMSLGPKLLSLDRLEVYFEDLVGHTKEIWDYLDNDRNTVQAVYDSYLSLITFETSQSTKTLTALAFIVFPATLVATLFTMDAIHTPFRGVPGDFWFMTGMVFLTAALTANFLRKKRWL